MKLSIPAILQRSLTAKKCIIRWTLPAESWEPIEPRVADVNAQDSKKRNTTIYKLGILVRMQSAEQEGFPILMFCCCPRQLGVPLSGCITGARSMCSSRSARGGQVGISGEQGLLKEHRDGMIQAFQDFAISPSTFFFKILFWMRLFCLQLGASCLQLSFFAYNCVW